MKCIGGPCDDEWFVPPSNLRLHDHVQIYERSKLSALNFNPYETKEIVVNHHIYVIDCFCFSKYDNYYFLRHESLTNKQAMLHQFSKKCLQNY